jgi:hypothetical protein
VFQKSEISFRELDFEDFFFMKWGDMTGLLRRISAFQISGFHFESAGKSRHGSGGASPPHGKG